jgi:hypothetical protein
MLLKGGFSMEIPSLPSFSIRRDLRRAFMSSVSFYNTAKISPMLYATSLVSLLGIRGSLEGNK